MAGIPINKIDVSQSSKPVLYTPTPVELLDDMYQRQLMQSLYNLGFAEKYNLPSSLVSSESDTAPTPGIETVGTPVPMAEVSSIQSVINKYSVGRPVVSAQDFISVSQQTGIPIDLMLAQAIQESNIGTQGRAARTHNIYNVGNDDAGNNKQMGDWRTGIYNYAQYIKSFYAPESGPITAESIILPKYVAKRGKIAGLRYATDPNYEVAMMSNLRLVRSLLKGG